MRSPAYVFIRRGANREMVEEYKRRARGDKGNDPKKTTRMKLAVVAIVVLILCAAAVYRFVPAVRHVFLSPAADSEKGAESAPVVKYTCPMHPFIVSERPGACSICGMSLVLQKSTAPARDTSDAAHLPGGVSLSPTQKVMANVATTKAALREFSMDTTAAGKVSWDERRLTRISARIAGRIERLHVNFTGARVGAGKPLFDMYSPDLVAAQKEYLLAVEGADRAKESQLTDSRSMMEGLREAARSRLKLWGMAEAQISELARTRQPKVVLTIFSPVSGVVTERLVTAGQYVNEGTLLFSVGSLSNIWVEAELYENELGRAAVGTSAIVTTDAYPGQAFRGRVAFVDPVVNPETRTLKVRVELANPNGLLKPEMFVKVALKGRNIRALVVPEGALVVTGDHAVAWIETAPGAFEPREVTIGRKGGGFCEVLSGLSEGESVASSGGFLIDSESQLKSARSGAPEEHGGKGR